MKKLKFETYKKAYDLFREIPTWTKEKHARNKELIDLIEACDHVYITCSDKNPNYLEAKHAWDYFIYDVPETKTGKMIRFRGSKVLILHVGKFGLSKKLLVVSIDIKL